jgi:hypothetical protein
MRLSEGTKSVLFGSHSVLHSVFVIIAWVKLYREWPKFWQFICILVHDVGYIGMNHITDGTNLGHSLLGAKIGKRLFGQKAFNFIVGHSRKDAEQHNLPLSKLEAPDDYSWILPPIWLLKLFLDKVDSVTPEEWRQAVADNWASPYGRLGGTDLSNKLRGFAIEEKEYVRHDGCNSL